MNARILHLDDADPACMQAARWAREAGNTVVYDGTWLHEDLNEFLPLVDMPIVSEPMVRRWMPDATPQQVVDRLHGYGAKIAVYTLGERGTIVRWREGTFTYPAFPVEAVDTTGAGDAFHGAFIYGLLQHWPVSDIIRYASAAAALNCRQLGGRSGLPNLSATEDFIAAHRENWDAQITKV